LEATWKFFCYSIAMGDKYLQRIDFKGSLEEKLKEIASVFALGKYLNHKVIDVGYEDFNIELSTHSGKYFIKIFASTRSSEDIKRYVKVMEEVISKGIKHPKLVPTKSGKHLYQDPHDKLQLVVMEWLDGKSFWDLNETPTKQDRLELIRAASLLNQLVYEPPFTYDSWSINNFPAEFEKCSTYLTDEDRNAIKNILTEFQKIDHASLPHSLVHGDLISTNVMKTDAGLYFVDFSVANYLPRIQELAVLLSDLLYDPKDAENSRTLYEVAKKEYCRYIELTTDELQSLPIYIKAAHAMHIIPPSKFIAGGEDNDENRHWLNLGQSGIELNIY